MTKGKGVKRVKSKSNPFHRVSRVDNKMLKSGASVRHFGSSGRDFTGRVFKRDARGRFA